MVRRVESGARPCSCATLGWADRRSRAKAVPSPRSSRYEEDDRSTVPTQWTNDGLPLESGTGRRKRELLGTNLGAFAFEGQTGGPEEAHLVAQFFPKNAEVLAETGHDESGKDVSGRF